MLRTDKPYHVAWLWGLGSRKGYRRIRAVVALDWHCRQYKGTRAPEYCSTRWALAVQGYQSTRVLQYWIGTASTRVPEQQSTAVLDGHWQYTSTHFLRHIYYAGQSQFINISLYWLICYDLIWLHLGMLRKWVAKSVDEKSSKDASGKLPFEME